ncbi:MAG TPA: hypothetical protein VNU93_00495 [Verrucomicrobiae bacterium]|nr:hypothetical protein [Verrucomicrobiae bacterium]
MNFVKEEIVDGSAFKLIRAWLTAGVMGGISVDTIYCCLRLNLSLNLSILA